MHEAFRDIAYYGDENARPVVCLHGSGGATKFADLIARRWKVRAICPLAASGKEWLEREEMLGLAFPGGDSQERLLEILDGVCDLLEEFGATWVAGHSQGACIVAEGVATGAWPTLRGAAMSCGALPGVVFDQERYDTAAWPALYMGWHANDKVFRKILGSTKVISMTRDLLVELGADVVVRDDDRFVHAPIWPDGEIKRALAEEMA